MRRFQGLPVSPGYAQGRVFLYRGIGSLLDAELPRQGMGPEAELARLDRSLRAARQELRALRQRIELEYGTSEAGILHAQFMILDDPPFREQIREKILRENASAESAVAATVREIEGRFLSHPDPYLRERAQDVRDVGLRLLRHLADRFHHPLAQLPRDVVVVASELLPSDTLFLDQGHVRGIVTEHGSEHSHFAILARSLEIPAVSRVRNILAVARPGDSIVVDGVAGVVILEPGGAEGSEYERKARAYRSALDEARTESHGPTFTLDGTRVVLLANINRPEEAEKASARGAEGVGLLRTEFLWTAEGGLLPEEDEERAYRHVLSVFSGRPVTIRTLDVRPEKAFSWQEDLPPAGGGFEERGIHYLLRHPELLRRQLRALLGASRAGSLRILLPMVTGTEEIEEVRRLLSSLRADLERRGTPVPEPPVGAMVETPPSVLLSSDLARAADFLSVGTNDLLDALFGTRRDAPGSEEHSIFEPSLLRAMHAVLKAGNEQGKDVVLCGEIAGTPAATALLVGLGFRHLSMSPQRLDEVRYNVRRIHAAEARAFAERTLALDTARAVREAVLAYEDPWRRLLERSEA
ncbi:MAG: phosphoenolpyruvate-protein phosphotransferase [Candidatus Binatia bacterium]|nr:MAG: phosphoenolpyruvate-protein phosphotransferase [Candidatus Binatia bacterium]